jgi:hypothetical protein
MKIRVIASRLVGVAIQKVTSFDWIASSAPRNDVCEKKRLFLSVVRKSIGKRERNFFNRFNPAFVVSAF